MWGCVLPSQIADPETSFLRSKKRYRAYWKKMPNVPKKAFCFFIGFLLFFIGFYLFFTFYLFFQLIEFGVLAAPHHRCLAL